MSANAAGQAETRLPARVRLGFYSAQNVPLLLSFGVLVAMIVLYYVLFLLKEGHPPGNFELSTTVNNTMSVGLAALGGE